MRMKVKFAIVGAGVISAFHAKAITAHGLPGLAQRRRCRIDVIHCNPSESSRLL